MLINENAVKLTLSAIDTFDTSKNSYLKVVGKGADQHLMSVKQNWFERLWMWLGFSSASMKNLTTFLLDHMEQLYKNSSCQKIRMSLVIDKVKSYDKKHPNRLTAVVKKVVSVKEQFDAATSPKPKNDKDRKPQVNGNNSAADNAAKTDVQKNKKDVKDKPADDNDNKPGKISLKDRLTFKKSVKKTLNLLKMTMKKAASDRALLKKQPSEKIVETNELKLFKQARKDPSAVHDVIKDIQFPLDMQKEYKQFINIVSQIAAEMTNEEIMSYVEDASIEDVFKIRLGNVYLPNMKFSAFFFAMNDDQICAMISGIAKWDLKSIKDAYYKMAESSSTLPNNHRFFAHIVSQKKFFEAIIQNPAPKPPRKPVKKSVPQLVLNYHIQLATYTIDCKLAAHYLKHVLTEKDKGLREEALKNFFKYRADPELFANEKFDKELNKQEKERLIHFLTEHGQGAPNKPQSSSEPVSEKVTFSSATFKKLLEHFKS